MDNEQKKPTITKEQGIFILRAVLFAVFAAVLPIVFILWRYGAFEGGKTSYGLGTLLCGILAFIAVRYALGEIKAAMPYSMLTQIITGAMNVILPLILLYVLLLKMRNEAELLMQCVIAVILCECVAIPVNPFPKWREEHRAEREGKTFIERAKAFRKIWKEGE